MIKLKEVLIHEDDDIILLNKPPGILTIPDRQDPKKPNLVFLLRKHYEDVFIVHRIDKDTSGLICFAKNAEAHRQLSIQFEKRQVKKTYLAFLDGVPSKESITVDKPIGPSPSKAGKMIVTRNGKHAISHYQLQERFKRFVLASFEIETGRTHQIRVHAQFMGHPLIIDPLYGKREAFYLSEIKGRKYQLAKKEEEERPLIYRSPLHAFQLQLQHPKTGENLTFEAPMPKDMRALHKQLKKWDS